MPMMRTFSIGASFFLLISLFLQEPHKKRSADDVQWPNAHFTRRTIIPESHRLTSQLRRRTGTLCSASLEAYSSANTASG
jgi:hypothetical protein